MTQTIYIALDDSGKLSSKEKISVYGGIIFFSQNEIKKFNQEYNQLTNSIKEKYFDKQTNTYPELKHFNLKPKDRLKFLNYLKHYHLLAGIIYNQDIYNNIVNNSKSKGRFLDYVVKMTIKNAMVNLIKENLINPANNLNIIINIDEQNLKSNGYYTLQESIYEELKHGMINFKNNSNFKPIIKGKLTINLNFIDSSASYLIQAADIIAGATRKNIINNKTIDFITYQIFFPK